LGGSRAPQEVDEQEGEDEVGAGEQRYPPPDLARHPRPGGCGNGQQLADRAQLDEGPVPFRVLSDAQVRVAECRDERGGEVEENEIRAPRLDRA